MFGGSAGDVLLNDTWLWNGQFWKQAQPPTRPLPQGGVSMAADPTTGTIVMLARGRASSETWLWDGTAKTWTLQTLPVEPPRRGNASMAFDKATGTVVLFGGEAVVGQSFDDTWVWDGRTKAWTPKGAVVRPPGRVSASMATDALTGTVVMFGGEAVHHGDRLGDTWVWNGANGTWTQQTPLAAPSPRLSHYMAYHPPTKKVVLFGGNDGLREYVGLAKSDTWTWDGTTRNWTKQKPDNRPCTRDQGEMAYHAGTRTAVIFGGAGDSPCPTTVLPRVQDTWAWDGVNWTQKA